MTEPTLAEVDQTVKTWLKASRALVLQRMTTPLNVDEKKRVGRIWSPTLIKKMNVY